MKKLSILFTFAAFTGIASASPYIIYSGWIGGSNLPAAGSDNSATQVYMATDVNNTADFAVLMINPTQKTYSVIGRPSDSPASDEATNNFLGAIGTGRSASAVFAYSIETTDSSSDSLIARAYATGPLATANLTLAPARRALSVPIITNRVTSGTYTFAASPTAITTGGASYASSLSGTSFGYAISTSGDIVHATTGGTIQLVYNSSLSGLANIGGAYVLSGANQMAVMPISIANGQSESDALVAWLSAYAQANGYTSPTSTNVNAYTGGVAVDGGSLSLSAAISGGSSLSVGGGGTLTLNNTDLVSTFVNTGGLTISGALTADSSSPLILGGISTGTTTTTGTSTPFNITGGGTLTIVTSGSITLNTGSTGSLTLGGNGLPSSGQTESFNRTLGISSGATLLITAVNNDGTVNGSVTSTSLSYTFTEATLTADGATTGFQVNATYPGEVILGGGTVTNTAGAYSFTGSTITATP